MEKWPLLAQNSSSYWLRLSPYHCCFADFIMALSWPAPRYPWARPATSARSKWKREGMSSSRLATRSPSIQAMARRCSRVCARASRASRTRVSANSEAVSASVLG
ncbi:hypothetical protein D3C72_1755460 [compost metagenome]